MDFDTFIRVPALSGALPVEHRLAGVALFEEAQIVHPRYLGMAGQIFGDKTGGVVRPRHADLGRFERAHQHPTRIRIELRARQLIICFTRLASPLMLPPTRSLWPPTGDAVL